MDLTNRSLIKPNRFRFRQFRAGINSVGYATRFARYLGGMWERWGGGRVKYLCDVFARSSVWKSEVESSTAQGGRLERREDRRELRVISRIFRYPVHEGERERNLSFTFERSKKKYMHFYTTMRQVFHFLEKLVYLNASSDEKGGDEIS